MRKSVLIAGPCVIESAEVLEEIALKLRPIALDPKVDFYFKASFDKANRTSLESYRGPGLQKGLEMLEGIKTKFGYKILTDIHESAQAGAVAEVADVLQIPAFLCRQTDLIVAAAKTKSAINIKKGQFMHPRDMQFSALKALNTRAKSKYEKPTYPACLEHGIYLCERGVSFGYGNLVVDMRSLVIMRAFAPVIFDATHSVQMPGAAGGKSGGERVFVPYLAKASAVVGVDGFFMETHTNPEGALSDGPNMIPISRLLPLVQDLLVLQEINASLNNA
ncbi:3-deoxy-8-phosphooctulonate synthase [Helicobacter ailurogastricus]|uniref:2-dehydro-3-deoxyphosphooctonate aldolase n=1 Tax=Helicobacter ailurogastricus TaxID=1578720 RepID=A0A0K2X3J9_9HELI|nr:3-deoxy-8-phosphooctulonate synthase [Helicobacter ailurogastricus]CRF40326.1 2-Keto-3-deoxy-D-manno-octulosonate-8-phosphate synthase [Helicobacter ailurogastricus]CRF42393.1 2-Keto-3-deoxy-D-manno-octulosonate-8-phosphate synthase [Helicobacter ailurogastricus]CRF44666.1 2-Keto-3-deoxy-D-manno-octulosonate-8-phosphate synthase [Helicobacter ailurogastricus]